MIRGFYNHLLAPALLAGYRAFALANPKAREFFQIRESMFERLAEARKSLADGPLVLVHVASVGELLEALPIIKAMAALPAPPLVALSHTSPSVSNHLPRELQADLVTPSPLDRPREVDRFLDLVRPSLIVFSSYDLWPNLAWRSAARGVPLALANGRLPSGSGRLQWPARTFFSSVYPHLAVVGAIDQESAESFPRLGVAPDRVRVTGNCRFDQTLSRCRAVKDDDPDLAPMPRAEFTLVAGSTWPEDQERLLPALSRLLQERPNFAVTIAPHEPTEGRVAGIEQHFRAAGVSTARYRALREAGESCPARVLVVDTVGALYKLYRRGRAAYVGGSFRQGVHNVMEPAGMKLPVLVGPKHGNSPEAVNLIRAGGGREVRDRAGIEAALAEWMDRPPACEEAGAKALALVEQSAGAAGRTMKLLGPLLNKLK